MEIQDFRVNCSSIAALTGNALGNHPVSDKDFQVLFNLLGRDYNELTEAQKNTARDIMLREIHYEPSKLNDTTTSELAASYAYQFFGKKKLSKGNQNPKQLEKGNLGEEEAIKILSEFDGVAYSKNEDKFTNRWFCGVPDILLRDDVGKIIKIIDIKISYDLPSYLLSLMRDEQTGNILEMMGYMDLTKCMNGEIVHILTNSPQQMIDAEPNKEIAKSMVFDEFSWDKKIHRVPVTFNKIRMGEIKKKATRAKNWVKQLHDKFTNP